MNHIPAALKYTASHEWLRLEEDGTLSVGISHHAQELLGDIVFIELPETGAVFAAEDTAGTVESVKAASDVYAPVAGEIIAVNEALTATPESVNESPYDAWFFRIKPDNVDVWDTLLSAEQYAEIIG